MSRRRKKQTRDQILNRLEENASVRIAAHREAARLIATGADAEVVTVEEEDENGVKRMKTIVRANRKCALDKVLVDGSRERKAVDWLQETISTANGENTPERRPDHIRGSSSGPPGQNINDDMMLAHDTLTVIEDITPPSEMRMLYELLKPEARLIWREIVQTHTGEKNHHCQSARVRAAASGLVFIQDNITRLMRDRRDRRVAA